MKSQSPGRLRNRLRGQHLGAAAEWGRPDRSSPFGSILRVLMHRLVCALGMAGAVAAACGSSAPEPQPTRIRIATTNAAVGEWLARLYNERIPGMQASAEPPETSRFNLRALEQGTADIGFVRADLAYAAYGRGTPLHPQPHAELRGVAVIGMSLLHVIVPENSRARAIADLRGGAVGLVSASSDATQRMTRDGDLGFYRSLLVATGQLTGADIRTVPMTGRSSPRPSRPGR